MNFVFMHRLSRAVIVLLALLSPAITLLADPPEAPLAKTADIDFSVEYSTDRLLLGDILYAKVTMRNKTDHAIRIAKFDGLGIRAEHPIASEILYHFGEFPGGATLLELAPGEEIVQLRILDMFGNDGLEDGEFNPFDPALEGQTVVLHASHSTLVSYQLGDVDFRDVLMKHVQKIQLGPPTIEKAAFDEAVAAMLKRADLKPLKLSFVYDLQTSYLFLPRERRPLKAVLRAFAARLHVLSQQLPQQSSARRAASILLQVDRFVTANGDAEDQAISSILSLLDEAPPMEQHFWRDLLLSKFRSARVLGTANQHIVPPDKYERFAKRMVAAGI